MMLDESPLALGELGSEGFRLADPSRRFLAQRPHESRVCETTAGA
jgi:hypothetical protein